MWPGLEAHIRAAQKREAERVWDMYVAKMIGEMAAIPEGLTLAEAQALLPG
jgi:hypothetical protein